MKASELIGKSVARTRPATYENGLIDYSYMEGGITILDVSKHGNIRKYCHITNSISIFKPCWNDDAWVECPKANYNPKIFKLFGKHILIY